MRKITLLIVAVALLSSGCSKWGWVDLKYPQSPAVLLPENINTIAVVNRSVGPDGGKGQIFTEAVLSGEIAGSDKFASDECLKGVFEQAAGWGRVSIVYPSKTRIQGTGTKVTPDPLDWNTVKSICKETNADALLVLETFDSNSDVILSTVTNQITNVVSGNSGNVVPQKDIKMTVICFWRLYDPNAMKIVDQYSTNYFMTFAPLDLSLNLPPPNALPGTAYGAGQEYISRFMPTYYMVRRDMYKRGKGSAKAKFASAFRKAEVANWQGAIDDWKTLADHPKRKNAGRACLNIAVGYEVLGNFNEAHKWAKKAYEDYGDKVARYYANDLKYRTEVE